MSLSWQCEQCGVESLGGAAHCRHSESRASGRLVGGEVLIFWMIMPSFLMIKTRKMLICLLEMAGELHLPHPLHPHPRRLSSEGSRATFCAPEGP